MSAVAVYLQTLRERQGIGRARLAELANTTEQTIWRIEEQGQEPKPPMLARLVRALQADWRHVEALLLNEDASDSIAQSLAYQRYAAIENELPEDAQSVITAAATADVANRLRLAEELRRLALAVESGQSVD